MTTKKLKAVLIALAGVGVLFNVHAYQNMKTKTNGDITAPGNWPLNPAYVDLSVSSAKVDGSWDANWGALPGEDLFLGADIVANRLMYDAGNRTTTVDLRGHTLTLLGLSTAPAIAFSGGASGSSLTFTNGNVTIPSSPYQGYALSMPYVELGRNQSGLATGTTLTIGENAILTAPKVYFYQGTNLTLNVKDGGKIVSNVQFGKNGGVGLTFRIDNGTYQHTGGDAFLSIGNSATAISNTLVLAGNWKTEGFTSPRSFPIGAVAGARGSRLVIESNAVVTIDDRPQIPSNTCADCGITVRNGGKLYFDNASDAGKSRFWLGNGANSADIFVTGEGSYLETKSTSPALIGQGSGRCLVRVTDKAIAKFATMTIGASSGESCSYNRMVVDHDGEIRISSLSIGGQNALASDNGTRAISNCLEVVDGGKVTSSSGSITIGTLPYAYRTGLRVVGENSTVSGVLNVVLSGTGYENTGYGNIGEQWMEVRDGGKVTIGNYLRTAARNCKIYIDGGEVSCATAVLTNGVSLVVGCQKDRMPSKPLLKASGSVYLGAHNYNTKLGKDAVTISMSDGSTIADDGELVVIEAAELKVDPEVVVAFNATLPEGFKARVRDNRLTVSHEKGLCLIFR